MSSFFSNLKISVKLMIGVGLSAILTLAIAALGIVSLHRTADATQTIAQRETRAVALTGDIRADQNRIQQIWLSSVIEHDRDDFEAMMASIAEARKSMDRSIEELQGLLPESQQANFDTLKSSIADYQRENTKIPPLWYAGRLDDAADVLQHDSLDPFKKTVETTDTISDAVQKRVEANAQRLEDNADSTIWQMIVFSAIGLLGIGGAVMALVRFQVSAPIDDMTKRMRSLADGDTSIDVANTDRRDEIGEMARAFLVFRDNARRQKEDAAAKAKADAEQREVVDALSHSLSGLSKGDLTVDIVPDFPPAYREVRANFNEAIANLRELILNLMATTATIDTGSREIASASEDLARRTEGNAASLEQTSAAVTQMNDRLSATAQAAKRTVDRADGAISTVAEGRNVADRATQAMSRVSESAKGIDSVIEGLDKIAFQTRVLAMNAAVEAGRAGEAGRGFAVVADLVSALAMRSEEESKRAREQLTTTQDEIVSAVDMVQKVDGALADILNDVGEVHSLVGNIASDNQAQSIAITEISSAIGAMDHSTQQNAAMVEQTSAAARNLSNEVAGLAERAGAFRTGSKAAAARRVSPPSARPKAAGPSNTRTAPAVPKAATARQEYQSPVSALPIAVPVDSNDDWASF
ncbi:HAMP domain-containing methyl-accepting chemotaxis protein [Stakelama pacifica]|uniref:Methyl-accepting chemotaxis protein n=1 Tax=Stakelama pacifica TaxID=517720 RepID=A0A4R6FH58_9SPHN|nr:methyl-accepting chemotaxis protein [Stakelama pacifica]TDN80643.1 methyl-accepting chemotaxis protein [Stakelama pacifica]GGO97560.1 methyl-accepting chemotaxis protein [Stakelama pacifica]